MMGIHYDLLHVPCYECLRLAWGGLVCRGRRRSKELEPHSRPKREGERRKKEGESYSMCLCVGDKVKEEVLKKKCLYTSACVTTVLNGLFKWFIYLESFGEVVVQDLEHRL